jgi:ATP-dependent Lhr-like helicase
MLRAPAEPDAQPVVISVTDPANVFNLPMPQDPARDSFVRPRSRSALLVTIEGAVVMIAERRAARITIRPGTPHDQIASAARALTAHVQRRARRDITIETIDGQPATTSSHAEAFRSVGFKRETSGLRYLRTL